MLLPDQRLRQHPPCLEFPLRPPPLPVTLKTVPVPLSVGPLNPNTNAPIALFCCPCKPIVFAAFMSARYKSLPIRNAFPPAPPKFPPITPLQLRFWVNEFAPVKVFEPAIVAGVKRLALTLLMPSFVNTTFV